MFVRLAAVSSRDIRAAGMGMLQLSKSQQVSVSSHIEQWRHGLDSGHWHGKRMACGEIVTNQVVRNRHGLCFLVKHASIYCVVHAFILHFMSPVD